MIYIVRRILWGQSLIKIMNFCGLPTSSPVTLSNSYLLKFLHLSVNGIVIEAKAEAEAEAEKKSRFERLKSMVQLSEMVKFELKSISEPEFCLYSRRIT